MFREIPKNVPSSDVYGYDALAKEVATMQPQGVDASFNREARVIEGHASIEPGASNHNHLAIIKDSHGTCYLDLGDTGNFAKEVKIPGETAGEVCFLRRYELSQYGASVEELYTFRRDLKAGNSGDIANEDVTITSANGMANSIYKITGTGEDPNEQYRWKGIVHKDSSGKFVSDQNRQGIFPGRWSSEEIYK